MNLQQLEYIIAVDIHRHFITAAEHCHVTQATLSMMIKKLEEELGTLIFDRSKKPIRPTETGEAIIAQAKIILQEANRLQEVIQEIKGEVKGELKLGIIPTVAPYLLPLFLTDFLKKYPNLRIRITELTTEQIIDKLKRHQLDAAILATPLNLPSMKEYPLYYEQFVVYASKEEQLMKKKFLLPTDIDTHRLWLLEEGHCLRSQIVNLCELRKKELENSNLEYEAGSIETLKKMVDMNKGVTIMPELAVHELSARDRKQIRYFKPPVPVREISIVTYQHFVKKRIIEVLREEILRAIPREIQTRKQKKVTDLTV